MQNATLRIPNGAIPQYGASYGQKPLASSTPTKCGYFLEGFWDPKSSKMVPSGFPEGLSERVCEKRWKMIHI